MMGRKTWTSISFDGRYGGERSVCFAELSSFTEILTPRYYFVLGLSEAERLDAADAGLVDLISAAMRLRSWSISSC